jgi:hypothetical protein
MEPAVAPNRFVLSLGKGPPLLAGHTHVVMIPINFGLIDDLVLQVGNTELPSDDLGSVDSMLVDDLAEQLVVGVKGIYGLVGPYAIHRSEAEVDGHRADDDEIGDLGEGNGESGSPDNG